MNSLIVGRDFYYFSSNLETANDNFGEYIGGIAF